MEGAAMSAFVFILRVKPPKPSVLLPGRQMVVVKSNVRIPDWVLNQLQILNRSPFYGGLPSDYAVEIERLRQNHVIVLHLRAELWQLLGDKLLEILAFAPANSRRHFPARIIHEERVTCTITKIVEYPIR
jgi:hypothetical protein